MTNDGTITLIFSHKKTFFCAVASTLMLHSVHLRYPKRLHKVVRQLLPECHVRFVLSDSGSSKGAALVTAVAQRLASRRRQVRMLCVSVCVFCAVCFIYAAIYNISLVFQVDETLSPFRLSQEQLRLVKDRMRDGLEAGLKSAGPSSVKMLPSFVYHTPDGTGQKLKPNQNHFHNFFKLLQES